jgi:anti-sigma B factor antagonist
VDIETRSDGTIAILDLSGKLTRGDGDERLRAAIDALIARGQIRLVVNLEKVPYMDSAGMGELISAHLRVTKAGGALRLLNPLRRVYDVLQLVKLDTVFEIYQEEAGALASLR